MCQSAKRLGLITFSKNTDSAFVESGFKNWKKGCEKFNDHEKSHTHAEATAKLNAYMNNEDVSARIRKEHSHNQERSRQALVKIVQSVKFLARQGLAVQGHSSDSENLFELMRLRGQDIPELDRWLSQRQKWMSHDIQNEMLRIMAHSVQRSIASDIQSARW